MADTATDARLCESSAFSWRMMMPVCAYSCVIDAINAAVVNAEVSCASEVELSPACLSHLRVSAI